MKLNAYKILGWIAMLLTPIGAVIFFGWRVYTAVFSDTQINQLAIVAGIATAIGLETVGIYAGHLAMDLWQRKDGRAWLAAIIMIVYVAIGMIELAGTIGQVMFMIAPLVYVLVGLRHAVDEQAGEETAVSVANQQFELEQMRLDKDLERKAKIADMKLKHDERMLRISQKNAAPKTAVRTRGSKVKNDPAKFYECACGNVYNNPNSYSAHKRHCKDKVTENGHRNGVVK